MRYRLRSWFGILATFLGVFSSFEIIGKLFIIMQTEVVFQTEKDKQLQSQINDMSQKDKAVPLVSYSPETGYHIHPVGKNFLQCLPHKPNYALLTAVGKCKTGKSFLLNQLLENQNIFPVSSLLNGCTKGIMISQKTIETGNGTTILILDTQGFGSMDSNDDIDCKLFMIAVLLSSTVLYNSLGTIDEQAINGISMVIQIGKALEKQLKEQGVFGFPNFMWLLRDFTLKLEDKQGIAITPKEYLQNALQQQKGLSQQANHKNRIRRVIKAIFPQRSCQTIVVPTDTQNDDLGPKDLRKQFKDDLARVKKKLLHMLQKHPKKLCKDPITIPNLIYSLQLIVNLLNGQTGIPKIDNLSSQITKKQLSDIKLHFQKLLQNSKQGFLALLGKQQNAEALRQIEQLYLTSKKSLSLFKGNHQTDQQLFNMKNRFIQQIQQINRKQVQLSQGDELSNAYCEYLTKINDDFQLNEQYARSIRQFRSAIKNDNFVNGLMRIQIAYLKRKLELTRQTDVQKEKLKLQLYYANRQIQSLKEKLASFSDHVANNKSLVSNSIRQSVGNSLQNPKKDDNQQRKGRIKKNRWSQNYQEEMKKIEGGSFYVPYVILESQECICVEIVKTLIKEDSKLNSYMEYLVEVTVNGFKWKVNRKYKDFCQLSNILSLMFPRVDVPVYHQAIVSAPRVSNPNVQKKDKIEQRRVDLECYLRELVGVEFIRNSRILQKFLKLNKEYPNNV